MIKKHIVEGQLIKYKRNGKELLVDILSDYYSPTMHQAHIYTLKVLDSEYYATGTILTESARVLYCTGKIIKDVPIIKYKGLVADKMVRKMVASKFKNIPKDIRRKL